ncbi:hypothetical protein [Nocardioides sp. CER19]|nr:hypothetical protein [Nocardioides sp. CER19]MDH2414376.1 hypothetical protein [Nocardioides sp. CER19]
MTKILSLLALALAVAALKEASRRLATHQAVLPELTTKVNTRVTRINQR